MESNDVTTNQDKVLTDAGLTLKGVQRIERINCDATYQDINLRSWQCSRLIRRDFYLVCYKMFFVLRNRAHRRTIKELLHDLREESDALAHVSSRWNYPQDPVPAPMNLRLVNTEAEILLETIVTVDKAIARMKNGEMAEVVEENILPYLFAFTKLKQFVLEKNDLYYTKRNKFEEAGAQA